MEEGGRRGSKEDLGEGVRKGRRGRGMREGRKEEHLMERVI